MLKEKLLEDMKISMRDKNVTRKNVIQMVRAAILQVEKDKQIELADDQILEIIAKESKKRKDSLSDYEKSGREDLINEAFAKKSDENAADKNARVPSAPNSTGKNEFGYKKGLRAKVVNELRIVWISRIAIVNNDSFRHKHLSVKIAKLMGRIAHECMLPHADFVEVFESFPKRDTQKFKEHNLYLYAGFKMSDEAIRSSKMVFLDYQDEGYINAGKLYLYKDLRDKE